MKTFLLILFVSFIAPLISLAQTPVVKEWTMLVFLNGHNNLDSFGHDNMNQLKSVGSSNKVNLVVQWASINNQDTYRVYVKKNQFEYVETLKPVNMGSVDELNKFIEWGVKNYPAKKYLIEIWNHGGGWKQQIPFAGIQNISYDEVFSSNISTEELGQAMRAAQKIIGHKVDVLGSDACRMSMLEVAGELYDSVDILAASQADIPGSGWPYREFVSKWIANPKVSGTELARMLSKEYLKAYSGGMYDFSSVTFSVLNLNEFLPLTLAIQDMVPQLINVANHQGNVITDSIQQTQYLSDYEYKDFLDFIELVEANQSPVAGDWDAKTVRSALNRFVIANDRSKRYLNANGVSVWIPKSYSFSKLGPRYKNLKFNQMTNWYDVLNAIQSIP